jgi:hypothetical protein
MAQEIHLTGAEDELALDSLCRAVAAPTPGPIGPGGR